MPRMKKTNNDKDGKYGYYKSSFVTGEKDVNGKPKRKYIRAKTQAEFDHKMAEAKRLHSRGLKLGKLTVKEWSEQWIDSYIATKSDVQRRHYQVKLNRDILPYIGIMLIQDVRTSHLIKILNAYTGGKKGTVDKIRQAIQLLFADAAEEGIIERDPAARLNKIELKNLTESPRRPLTEDERNAVLKAAEINKYGAWVLTMMYCGLRTSECNALERADVDLDTKRITINKAWNVGKENKGKLTPTKAGNMRRSGRSDKDVGVRIVPIPDALMPILEELCKNKNDNDILFPNAKGKHNDKPSVRSMWKSFMRQCHIEAGAKVYRSKALIETSPISNEMTPHYLRHSYATDLDAAGVSDRMIQVFLGHASKNVTDRYRGITEEAFERALKQINDYHNTKQWGKNEANKNSD